MRNLTEEEKLFVTDTLKSPFWGIFKQFVDERRKAWDIQSEEELSDDIPSILKREQLLGAKKHSKYLLVDFENFAQTQNQNQK